MVYTPVSDLPLIDRLVTYAVLHVSDVRAVGPILAALTPLPLPASASHLKRVKRGVDGEANDSLILICEKRGLFELTGARACPAGDGVEGVDVSDAPKDGPLARAIAAAGASCRGLMFVPVVGEPPADRARCAVESSEIWPMVFAPRAAAVAAAAKDASLRPPKDVESYFFEGLRAAERIAAQSGSECGVVFFVPPKAFVGGASPVSAATLRGEGASALDGNPFRSAVLTAIEAVAARDRATHARMDSSALIARRSDAPEDRRDPQVTGSVPESAGVKRGRDELPAVSAADASRPVDGAMPYLLTACDAFLTHEPCIMDAMALVHARVARVVFAHAKTGGSGALTCHAPLHETRGMNHHYLVYKLDSDLERAASNGAER